MVACQQFKSSPGGTQQLTPWMDFMVACQQFKSSPGGTQQLTSWLGFHGGISAIQIKPRRCTATHLLDGISWWHVSNSNQAQEVHSNSLPGWDFMVACQQFKSSPGGTQQLTPWMGFHGGMSAIQIKPRRHTATYSLDGISWWHVSNSNQAQEPHSNSRTGWDFIVACQQFKSSPGGTQQLTNWMGFHGGKSAIQIKPRRHTATHNLDGISWWHVSNSNQAQEAHSNSQTGWDFMVACQQFKSSPGGTQQLTRWMGFHGGMSAIQIKPRRHTATHELDGISWWHVSNSNQAQEAHSNSQTGWDFMVACQQFKSSPGGTQQLTSWMGFHGGMSAIQIKPRRHTATHSLDGISWWHVSNSNQAQEAHSNSLPGWDFMVACQQFKSSPGGTQQLPAWMGFHGGMSAIQIKPRRHTATHPLDGISWWHVSNSNQAQEAYSNSLPGWDFMVACQQFKSSPGGTQQLTHWMGFHGGMSAIQIKPRSHTATHKLDGIS